MNSTEIENRILTHYKKVLSESYQTDNEATSIYLETKHDVVRELLPYALENNYWWENKDVKMAYYQMKVSTLVVSPKAFKKYYHRLMGKHFDPIAFSNPSKRKELVKEAELRYNKKSRR